MGETASGLADELCVQRLMSEYCRRVDDGRFEAVAELFVEDGVFDYRGIRHAGRRALVAFLLETQVPERRGRHSCGYSLVEFDRPGHAGAVTDFVFYGRADSGWFVKFIGRYLDVLRCGAEGWQFVERRVELR